ncbi:fimbrial biogenesis chaperone [Escherichia coli]|uniref:fimbrial biogenesis chaperone n=1 Tax=Escherichia coli TaxID=562 RepID=UPI000246EA93|nr:molecular chaperone [Escherichia coli]EHN94249.1 hypothetical protein ESOG_04676 [Escherichia coli E101]
MNRLLIFIGLFCVFFHKIAISSETFGPYESRLIFDGDKKNITYRIDNSGKLVWLVQGWVEDVKENKTNIFNVVPSLFRVEPKSQYTARVVKNGDLPEDRESIFWIVSNSLPGGNKGDNEGRVKEDSIDAKLNLAFRYKVPMIYRPASLGNIAQKPEKLQWKKNSNGKVKLFNPTNFAVQLQYVSINGIRKDGQGITYIIAPYTGVELNLKANSGTKIKYGVINDYGAVQEYEGAVE